MSVRRVEGRSSVLGHVRMRLPHGLVAVVGSDDRVRSSFLRLLRRSVLGAPREGLGVGSSPPHGWNLPSGVSAEDLVDLRVGLGLAGPPADVLDRLSETLARLGGALSIDEAIARLDRENDGERKRERPEPASQDRLSESLDAAREELAAAERELQDLRADHTVLAGEVEAATMDWLRERQDAETHLQAYRDRARELRDRLTQLEEAGREAPCPTCQRVLGTHFDTVATELRDEWESVVQDGRWWKRRREQLDLKPQSLREIEARSLRLQAAMEHSAERVERSRLRSKARERSLARPDPSNDDVESEGASPLLAAMRSLRATLLERSGDGVLEAGSHLLLRISGGRLLGMSRDEVRGAVVIEGMDGVLEGPVESDDASAVVALRLGAAILRPDWGEPGFLVVGDPFDLAHEETRLRTLDALSELLPRIPQILVVTGGEIVDVCPEAFDAVLELPAAGQKGRTYVRPRPAAIGSVRVVP